MDSVITALIDYGMAGLFLAFMVWNYLQSTKRMDTLQDKFLDSLEKLRKDNKDNEDLIRSRYDKVIETYQTQKDTLLIELKEAIKGLTDSVQRLEGMESSSIIRITEVGDTVDDVKSNLDRVEKSIQTTLVEIDKDTDEILLIIREQQQEKKLKEIAKKMVAENPNPNS